MHLLAGATANDQRVPFYPAEIFDGIEYCPSGVIGVAELNPIAQWNGKQALKVADFKEEVQTNGIRPPFSLSKSTIILVPPTMTLAASSGI